VQDAPRCELRTHLAILPSGARPWIASCASEELTLPPALSINGPMAPGRRALDLASYAFGSLLVALLPEALKREGRLSAWASPAAHVVSGLGESLLCAALFWVGMIRYVTDFGRTAGWTYLIHQPTLDTGSFLGVGALAYLSYLLQPQAVLLLYCFVEGLCRALGTVYGDRLPGLGLARLVWWGWHLARQRSRAAKLALLLGPDRPDELVQPADSRYRMLELYTVADKLWSDEQVLAIGGAFYRLASKRLIRRGVHHAYQYLFHELEEREVIRGVIVRYQPPSAAEPPAPDPGPPRAPGTTATG
jgi:hypothetical protein